jgi:hypothetical protein
LYARRSIEQQGSAEKQLWVQEAHTEKLNPELSYDQT